MISSKRSTAARNDYPGSRSSARSLRSAVHHQHLNESATPWGDYRHTGRHTWTTSCRALVEKNLKAGSGGGERVPGERGMREKVRRRVLFEGPVFEGPADARSTACLSTTSRSRQGTHGTVVHLRGAPPAR